MKTDRTIGIATCIVLVVLAACLVGFAVEILRRRQHRRRRMSPSPRTLKTTVSEICLSSSTWENIPATSHALNTDELPGSPPQQVTFGYKSVDPNIPGIRRVRFEFDSSEEKEDPSLILSDLPVRRLGNTVDWISWILNPGQDPPMTCSRDLECNIPSIQEDCHSSGNPPTGILKNSLYDERFMVEI